MASNSKKDRSLVKTPSGDLVAYQQEEFRVGILPPPDELERYEAMYSGTTKIILESYIVQTEHRMKLESTVIEGDNRRANIGQIISGVLSFSCIAAGTIAVILGKDATGLALIFGSIGSILTAFYGGAILRKTERTQKDKN